MHIIFRSFLILCSTLFFSNTALAQQPGQCLSNQNYPVPYIIDYNLNNVGIATTDNYGNPIIVMNPNILNQFPSLAKEFWFAHECAHHALPPWENSEINADCYAVRNMLYNGLLQNPAAVNQFFNSIAQLPGSVWTGHLPGPARVQAMHVCINNG